ncbi:hypothetical protein EVAR_20235_1 [Eumeta japonica]|uniref:Uncharacterized protein n=1 Tax=Eumeta variegata TaxID=151549 RepID=A0A4C1W838_EUMVA|nr:hypothetical protein EVAR_20235_1 [Eumeta japonica]
MTEGASMASSHLVVSTSPCSSGCTRGRAAAAGADSPGGPMTLLQSLWPDCHRRHPRPRRAPRVDTVAHALGAPNINWQRYGTAALSGFGE